MGAYRGNADIVMADAAEIVRRLKETEATVTGLIKEYLCSHSVMLRAILSQISKAEYRRICRKNLLRGGVKTRFQEGHKSWNKGTGWVPGGRSIETRFNKGHLPENHKHAGTITIRNDKCGRQYRWIKVSGIMDGKHRWLQYARYLWEKENGPIPDGLFPVHFDGDTLNDSIGNLRLVDRAGHLALSMARDPNMLKKCRRNSVKANRKRGVRNRRLKAKETESQKKAKQMLLAQKQLN